VASSAGATPLYGVLNMQWAPKARHPQPAHYMQQTIGYLDLAGALLEAGADPNARLRKSLWYTTYNRDLLSVDRTGATPFWWAAYTLDVPAMKLLLKYGADPRLGTAKVPERYEEAVPSRMARTAQVFRRFVVRTGGRADSCCVGRRLRSRVRRQYASARADGWLPAVKFLVEELGADVNAKDHNGLHAAAPCGVERRQRADSLSRVQRRGCEGREPQRSDHGRHGERARTTRGSRSRDHCAAREPRREEQSPLCELLNRRLKPSPTRAPSCRTRRLAAAPSGSPSCFESAKERRDSAHIPNFVFRQALTCERREIGLVTSCDRTAT